MERTLHVLGIGGGWRRAQLWRAARAQRVRGAASEGFTLIEIMVVVMIIGLIVGSVGFVAFNRFKTAQIKSAQAIVKTVEGAIEMYMMDHNGECPKNVGELRSQRILSKEPKDPWNEVIIFRCPGEKNSDGADVFSKGPDKKEGTEDDLKNWEE
ncbi:MAG: type II secretion system protein GspG [Proteobacteria bacterium]|nr:type II secretion system protein GspG [Pseudomonadota bacterium]